MPYKEFRVTVDQDKTHIARPSGVETEGDVRMSPLTEQTIRLFAKWVAEDRDCISREVFEVLGSYLFDVLFDKDTRTVFKTEYDRIRKSGDMALRVILEFKREARDLAILPWEYIYYPDSDEGRGFFIATDNQLILTRHVPLVIKDELKPGRKPLRILVVIAKPPRDSDDQSMNIVQSDPLVGTIDDLKNQLGPEAIQVEQLEKPTKVSLTHKVQGSDPFHVVHFVGHGKYENDRGYLALMSADDEKKAAWMKDTDLADMFRKCAPRLIFLHACEGAHSESYAAFRGLALQLAYSNIPAVVAMQYQVPNKAANQFANTFYRSLGEGKPIDVAVQAGRLSLGTLTADDNYISREFGSPVVYLQSAEGIIIAESKQPAEESQPAPVRKVICPYGKCTNYVVQGDKCCDSGHKPLAVCITSGCPGVVIPGKFCRLCEQRQPGGDRPNVGIQAQTAAAGLSQAAPQDFGVKQNPGTNVADLGAATSPSTLGTTGSPGAGLNGGTR